MLDIGLPGIDGLEALRQLKARSNLPVIFLTARRRELDEVLGLELGADDYITKPFDAQLPAPTATRVSLEPVTVGDLMIDPTTHTVTLRAQALSLPPREFDLVRLCHDLATVEARFTELRYLIAEVVLPGMLFGSAVGVEIALTLTAPIKQMQQTISGPVRGH